jgi:hypothetical protein
LHDSPPHGPSEEGAHLPQELNDVYEEVVPGTFFDVTRAVVLVTDASQLALWGTLFRSEEGRWTVGHDARLTLLAPARAAASRETWPDLVFYVTRSGRHLSDDLARGVRGHFAAHNKEPLTCGFLADLGRGRLGSTCFP